MKKYLFAPMALAGACAVCCALPFLPGMFVGVFSAGAGLAFGDWRVGVGLVVVLALLWRMRTRLTRAGTMRAPCKTACVSPQASKPCACQIDGRD